MVFWLSVSDHRVNIEFLKQSQMKTTTDFRHQYPIYLFSYGGSGNTMTRLLLEYTTNIWTGSVYNDKDLIHAGFEGEKVSSYFDNLVIKAHPELIDEERLRTNGRDLFLQPLLTTHLASDIATVYTNMSAIFIVRNPWKAIFSMYQQSINGFGCDERENKMLNKHKCHV